MEYDELPQGIINKYLIFPGRLDTKTAVLIEHKNKESAVYKEIIEAEKNANTVI